MVGRGMAVNAEEILAGSSFPSSQRWSRRKLLYLENRDGLIIFGERALIFNTYISLVAIFFDDIISGESRGH